MEFLQKSYGKWYSIYRHHSYRSLRLFTTTNEHFSRRRLQKRLLWNYCIHFHYSRVSILEDCIDYRSHRCVPFSSSFQLVVYYQRDCIYRYMAFIGYLVLTSLFSKLPPRFLPSQNHGRRCAIRSDLSKTRSTNSY